MGLRIATTSTIGWPYVRRGNRFIYELAVYLASQGHQVHHITAKPGKVGRERIKRDLLIKYCRLFGHPILSSMNIHFFETFVPLCFHSILSGNYDIVHSFLYPDAYAASLVKKFKNFDLILSVMDGIPLYWNTRFARSMFKGVVKRATQFHAPSEFARQCLMKEFEVDAEIIPLPVDTVYFQPLSGKDMKAPRILCTAALSVARKGVDTLVGAFEKILKHIPNASLVLSGHVSEESKKKLLESVTVKTRNSIEFRGVGRQDELHRLYGEATITVLPSINEPFGMVILESLACGTPVVGTRSGAIPEILTDAEVGVIFDRAESTDELCNAMIRCIEMARCPNTSKKCREFSENYSWQKVGPRYEKMYYRVLK